MSTVEIDVFEMRLDDAVKRIQACQGEKQVDSCSKCEHFIGCEERNAYIKAVYDSMSKGETGGFEF